MVEVWISLRIAGIWAYQGRAARGATRLLSRLDLRLLYQVIFLSLIGTNK